MLVRRGNAEYHSYGSVFEGIDSEDIFRKRAISRSGGKAIVDEEGRQVASRGGWCLRAGERRGDAGERAPESGRGRTWRGAVGTDGSEREQRKECRDGGQTAGEGRGVSVPFVGTGW